MSKKQLKLVRLLEPHLCKECRFADIAFAEKEDGGMNPIIHCRRLDCDNWDYSTIEDVDDFELTNLRGGLLDKKDDPLEDEL